MEQLPSPKPQKCTGTGGGRHGTSLPVPLSLSHPGNPAFASTEGGSAQGGSSSSRTPGNTSVRKNASVQTSLTRPRYSRARFHTPTPHISAGCARPKRSVHSIRTRNHTPVSNLAPTLTPLINPSHLQSVQSNSDELTHFHAIHFICSSNATISSIPHGSHSSEVVDAKCQDRRSSHNIIRTRRK